MAFLGFGQEQPFAAAEQNAQDRQTAFQGIKDNLPALGLVMGLSMLARNNGTRSAGQLIGQGGADALNAYGTWQKIQEAKARQEKEDQWKLEDREYNRSQDAFKNSMAEKQFGLDAMKTQQELAMQRARLGLAQAQHALARQNALAGNWELAGNGMIINKKTGELRPLSEEQKKLLGAAGGGLGYNPDDPAVKKFGEEMAKKGADMYIGLQEGAQSAHGTMAKMDQLDAILDRGIYTGMGGGAVQGMRKLGAALGLTDAQAAADGEALEKISNEMALLARSPNGDLGGMPGSMSDQDRKFVVKMQPGLDKSVEGNRMMIEMSRRMAKRKIEIARMASDYVRQHGKLDSGFNDTVREYSSKNPMFGDLGAPKAAQGAGAGLPSDIRWTK